MSVNEFWVIHQKECWTFYWVVYWQFHANAIISNTNVVHQSGQYTKVGNKITFALRINSNSHNSDGDQLYVGGLPFAVNFTNTSNRIYVQVDGSGLDIAAGSGYYKLVGQLSHTNQSITLLQQGDNVVQDNFRANNLAQTKEIYITGTYFTST